MKKEFPVTISVVLYISQLGRCVLIAVISPVIQTVEQIRHVVWSVSERLVSLRHISTLTNRCDGAMNRWIVNDGV